MPTDRDELKTKLLAQAEAAIDKMLSDERLSEQMTLSEIERPYYHCETCQKTQELDEMAHGVNVNYTAVLGSKDAFKPVLWALAVQHDLPTARNRSGVADGALWIWDVAEGVCPDGTQVVDWFHAVEHLNEATYALYPVLHP